MSARRSASLFSRTCDPRGARRGRRGSVIVVVLVTLLLASFMIMKFMDSSAVELTLATRAADRDRLRADAYSALETLVAVMAEIKEVDEGLHSPDQGWGDPYAYSGDAPREGVTVTFEFTEESGRQSLPKLGYDEMVELAEALGLTRRDAERFSDSLLTWMSADHVTKDVEAEASNYEREALPHRPPHRSLRSWEELRAVRVARDLVYDEEGALTPFGSALRENLSLYDFDGVNVNSLAPALGVARGWDPNQLAQVERYRSGLVARAPGAPRWFRSSEELTQLLGANTDTRGLGTEVKLLRVGVKVAEGAASFRLEALLALTDDVKFPEPAKSTAEEDARTTPPNGETAPTAPGAKNKGKEETLNYPFRLLEVNEAAGPAPAPPPNDEEPAP